MGSFGSDKVTTRTMYTPAQITRSSKSPDVVRSCIGSSASFPSGDLQASDNFCKGKSCEAPIIPRAPVIQTMADNFVPMRQSSSPYTISRASSAKMMSTASSLTRESSPSAGPAQCYSTIHMCPEKNQVVPPWSQNDVREIYGMLEHLRQEQHELSERLKAQFEDRFHWLESTVLSNVQLTTKTAETLKSLSGSFDKATRIQSLCAKSQQPCLVPKMNLDADSVPSHQFCDSATDPPGSPESSHTSTPELTQVDTQVQPVPCTLALEKLSTMLAQMASTWVAGQEEEVQMHPDLVQRVEQVCHDVHKAICVERTSDASPPVERRSRVPLGIKDVASDRDAATCLHQEMERKLPTKARDCEHQRRASIGTPCSTGCRIIQDTGSHQNRQTKLGCGSTKSTSSPGIHSFNHI